MLYTNTWGWSELYIYGVCLHGIFIWQGNHQIYGHIRCIFTTLVNPTNMIGTTVGVYTLFLAGNQSLHTQLYIGNVNMWGSRQPK
jgi:hypothetical protein